MHEATPVMMVIDKDEINLLAIKRVLQEAQIRVSDKCEVLVHREAQYDVDAATDRRAQNTAGNIAAQECMRFEGEARIESSYRQAKERRYSMYAMHPDTAEQLLKAVDMLIERSGPRLQFYSRATSVAPKTVRNKS